tara:strand:+ start:276 stop:566 length:291 start_codon:yes stop_codon:yes gene_type:complete
MTVDEGGDGGLSSGGAGSGASSGGEGDGGGDGGTNGDGGGIGWTKLHGTALSLSREQRVASYPSMHGESSSPSVEEAWMKSVHVRPDASSDTRSSQ